MLSREDRTAIEGLFERLAEAQQRGGPRDAEAEALIRQKIAAQPAAPYYLAQTVVVQQEALKEAERRIEELEGRAREVARGPWDRDERYDDRRQQGYAGGGFLAGAAQTALGVAGGVMLGSLIGSMFGAGAANAGEPATSPEPAREPDVGTDDGGGFDGGFDIGGDF